MAPDAQSRTAGFGAVWEAVVMVGRREDERFGLSPAEVASRGDVGHTAVAKLKNDPTDAAFARIVAYARAQTSSWSQGPGYGARAAGRAILTRRPPRRHEPSYGSTRVRERPG